MTIQRGKKLVYALPLSTELWSVENFKKHEVTECQPRKHFKELKSSKKLTSLKLETDDGLS